MDLRTQTYEGKRSPSFLFFFFFLVVTRPFFLFFFWVSQAQKRSLVYMYILSHGIGKLLGNLLQQGTVVKKEYVYTEVLDAYGKGKNIDIYVYIYIYIYIVYLVKGKYKFW